MSRGVIGLLAVLALCAVSAAAVGAQEVETTRERLESIRQDLVELRFERALAALEGLLGDPRLTQTERGEALVLRAQAHVAFGDLDAAEVDYRQILELRPGYEPAQNLTPDKAMKRFLKVQRATVGHVVVELDPADARLSIDGVEVVLPPDRRLPLLAGEHELRAERSGHDPYQRNLLVAAGEESSERVELVPNARTVIVRTVPTGVEVRVDGRLVGVTDSAGAGFQEAGELVIENIPLGDHAFDLSKPCYRTRRLLETLAVDLLDRSPLRLETIALAPVRSTLVLRGGPEHAEVRLDEASLGRLPLSPQQVCPGAPEIEVLLEGRTIWRSVERLLPATETVIGIEPRPNLALLGAEVWPRALREFAARFNTRPGPAPPSDDDLSDPAAWRELGLPPDTDLALAVRPAGREGARERWFLYSPILRRVELLDLVPTGERPAWSAPAWGFTTVDATKGGPVLVAEVRPSGPAAAIGLAPGDRLGAVGGLEVWSTRRLRAALGSASASAPIEFEWTSADGQPREAELRARMGPRLFSDRPPLSRAAYRAAWAAVDIASGAPDAGSARANLALLLSAFGRHELAATTWKQVDWGERSGVGEGTKQYYLGRALQALGREAEAVAAYRKAAASAATAFDDDGPPIAPAAADRLADLGKSSAP